MFTCICVCVLCVSLICLCTVYVPGVSVCYVCPWCQWMPEKASDPPRIRITQLWVSMWVLGIEPESSVRSANPLNNWTLSPAPSVFFSLCTRHRPISVIKLYLQSDIFIVTWHTVISHIPIHKVIMCGTFHMYTVCSDLMGVISIAIMSDHQPQWPYNAVLVTSSSSAMLIIYPVSAHSSRPSPASGNYFCLVFRVSILDSACKWEDMVYLG